MSDFKPKFKKGDKLILDTSSQLKREAISDSYIKDNLEVVDVKGKDIRCFNGQDASMYKLDFTPKFRKDDFLILEGTKSRRQALADSYMKDGKEYVDLMYLYENPSQNYPMEGLAVGQYKKEEFMPKFKAGDNLEIKDSGLPDMTAIKDSYKAKDGFEKVDYTIFNNTRTGLASIFQLKPKFIPKLKRGEIVKGTKSNWYYKVDGDSFLDSQKVEYVHVICLDGKNNTRYEYQLMDCFEPFKSKFTTGQDLIHEDGFKVKVVSDSSINKAGTEMVIVYLPPSLYTYEHLTLPVSKFKNV